MLAVMKLPSPLPPGFLWERRAHSSQAPGSQSAHYTTRKRRQIINPWNLCHSCVCLRLLFGGFWSTQLLSGVIVNHFHAFLPSPTHSRHFPQLDLGCHKDREVVIPIQVKTRTAAKYFIPKTGTNQLLNNFYQFTYCTTKSINKYCKFTKKMASTEMGSMLD